MLWLLSLTSVVLVSLISFVGIFTFKLNEKKLRKLLLYLVSFSVGGLLGDSFIHLLPESVKLNTEISLASYILLGIIISFIVEKFIQWRHCHIPTSKEHPHPFAIMNLIGDSVHNFIDGLIIGVSYLASFQIGITTTLAVILHEIPQEIGDFGVLIHGGFKKEKALLLNFFTALIAIIGTLTSLIIGSYFESLTKFLLPFAIGNFLYIASSDLIPELQKEVNFKKSLIELIMILFGIAIMFLLLFLE
ncbi:MAG: ZIP family metal transporter [Candidatus Aenigmatarchaeota archaeon]